MSSSSPRQQQSVQKVENLLAQLAQGAGATADKSTVDRPTNQQLLDRLLRP